jgi:hypothetical protein
MDSLLFLIDSYEPIVLKDITNFSSSVVSNNQANIEKVIIGSSVVLLEDYCFENCINMVYIYIPGTVSIIGANCFRGCINLNEVLISRGVQILGEACFKGCKNLTHFKIPLTITHIYSNCFEDCINLNEIEIQKQQNIIMSLITHNQALLDRIVVLENLQGITGGCTGYYSYSYTGPTGCASNY